MKALIASIVMGAMLVATPAEAGDRRSQSHRERSSGKWIAPLVGGIVLGAIIADSNNREEEQRQRHRYRYRDGYIDKPSAYPTYPVVSDDFYQRNRYREFEIIERGPNGHYCVTRNYIDRYGYPTLTSHCR